jgi:photosystem II stability/assembly factor-like uncharacterized protein
MRRDDVRDALEAMASGVAEPSADASAVIARGRRRMRRQRLTIGGIVALLLVIVVGAGVITSKEDGGTPRVSSVPTTLPAITVGGVYTGPVHIPIAFASPTEGWLCSGSRMEHTTNAGATWESVTVPFGPPAPPRVQQPVCAAVAGGEAWMITTDARHTDGLQVIRVSDGGRDVETSPFPAISTDWTVRELSFADRDHGWAFVRSAGGGATGTYVTSDGGRTWVIETPVRHAPLWDSPNDAWTTLELPPSQRLTHTTDGGRTWEQLPLGSDGSAQLIAVDGDTVVVLALTRYGTRNDRPFALSVDGGHSWDFRRAPRGVVNTDSDVAPPPVASALDADRWWLGSDSRLFATTDGGEQWTQIAEFAGISRITDVRFLTPEIGLVSAIGAGDAANSTVVLRTDDGGESWLTVAVNAPPMGDNGPINFPGGIFGCPTHPLAAPPPGSPPSGLVDAATRYVRADGGTVATIEHAYPVGQIPAGSYGDLFEFQIPSCGPETVASSWVVETLGPPGEGPGGSTDQTQVVLAYSTDGWHVYGRYH